MGVTSANKLGSGPGLQWAITGDLRSILDAAMSTSITLFVLYL